MKKHPSDPSRSIDALFDKSAKRLRTAAKACRINKGGAACVALDVAAAVVDNAVTGWGSPS